jgi:abortive infection bacteriophage resistance protein
MRIWAGFSCPVPVLPIPFNKPPLSVPDQLQLLVSRGLAVPDPAVATHYLTHIGYYRLSGYALPFQKGSQGSERHDFKNGAAFEDLLERYIFDRKLRLVAMDAIERIEVSVRAAMSNALATRHGAHWYMMPTLFSPSFNHARFIDDIKRQIGHEPNQAKRRDVPIQHYYQTYSQPDMPPSWMVFESITFGTISFAYSNLLPGEFDSVRAVFALPHPVLSSWLHSVNYVRNICAHHGRLWNRECRIRPLEARAYKAELTPNARVYAQFVAIQIMLGKIAPENHWAEKLRDLLAEHPTIPLKSMGFPETWRSRPIWGLE